MSSGRKCRKHLSVCCCCYCIKGPASGTLSMLVNLPPYESWQEAEPSSYCGAKKSRFVFFRPPFQLGQEHMVWTQPIRFACPRHEPGSHDEKQVGQQKKHPGKGRVCGHDIQCPGRGWGQQGRQQWVLGVLGWQWPWGDRDTSVVLCFLSDVTTASSPAWFWAAVWLWNWPLLVFVCSRLFSKLLSFFGA